LFSCFIVVVLVTGGNGLVGAGIRAAIEQDKRDDEEFVFVSSKEADLRSVVCLLPVAVFVLPLSSLSLWVSLAFFVF
jgi:hypothetical protein